MKKLLSTKTETLEVGKATVIVTLQDGTTATISRIDSRRPRDDSWFDSYWLLDSYLSGKKTLFELDDDRRVPACNIKEISPIVRSRVTRTFETKSYRDWCDWPFVHSDSVKVIS